MIQLFTKNQILTSSVPVKLAELFQFSYSRTDMPYSFSFGLFNKNSTNSGYIVYKGTGDGSYVNGQQFKDGISNVKWTDLYNFYYIPGLNGSSETFSVNASYIDILTGPLLKTTGWTTSNLSTAFGSVSAVPIPKLNPVSRSYKLAGIQGLPVTIIQPAKFYGVQRSLYFNINRTVFSNPLFAGGYAIKSLPTDIFKLGVQYSGGISFPNVTINGGGISGSLLYDTTAGIKLSSVQFAPASAIMDAPSIFSRLDLVESIHLNPTLNLWGKAFTFWKTYSGSINITLPRINYDGAQNLYNFNTMRPGDTYSNPFLSRIGSIAYPNFTNLSPKIMPTPAISSTLWNNGYNNGIAPVTYGYSGSTAILDIKLWLSSFLGYIGLPNPLAFNLSASAAGFTGRVAGVLADAALTFKSNFNWNFSASLKTNMWYTLEGSYEGNSLKKYELFTGENNWIRSSALDAKGYTDLNGDNKIDVTTYFNPIINVQGSANIDNTLGYQVDALRGSASLSGPLGFSLSTNFGPLISTGNVPIASAGSYDLGKFNTTFDLFSIDPGLSNPSDSNIFARTTSISIAPSIMG